MKLLAEALAKFLLGVAMTAALLFVPAGSFSFGGAWRFVGLLFVPMAALGVILYIKKPELLQKRLNGREKEKTQKGAAALLALILLGSLVLSGLDYRFGWSDMPDWIIWMGCVVMLMSYGLYARVMGENRYLARTVEIQKGQQLIDTGSYAVVRHPMYAASIFMFLSSALVLGSWMALGVMIVYPAVMVARIRNEEMVLEQGLPGYADYMRRVKWRLIPFVW